MNGEQPSARRREDRKVPGLIKRVLRKIDFIGKMKVTDGDQYKTYEEPVVADVDEANVITSVVWGSEDPRFFDGLDMLSDEPEHPAGAGATVRHAPVFDFDFPCTLLESSTPGHYHLILDKEIRWDHYAKLMKVMGDAGLLEEGYVAASIQRGYTSIRLPWIKRHAPRQEYQQ